MPTSSASTVSSGAMPGASLLIAASARYKRLDRWAPVSPELDCAIEADVELAHAALAARRETMTRLRSLPVAIGTALGARFAAAFERVRRERFALPDDIGRSALDEPLPLDARGDATVSAPHAYLFTFALLDLSPGDRLLELGTGTGYGAALARVIVGPAGHVTTLEVEADLAVRARRLLLARASDEADVMVLQGDASSIGPNAMRAARPNKIAFTYALPADPQAFLELMAPGARLVAPVGAVDAQELVAFLARAGGVDRTVHGGVRYVAERHES